MKRLFKIIVLLITLTGFSVWGGNAYAVTITSTATGGLWSAATTWVGGVVPTTQNVVIATTSPNAVTLGVNTTFAPTDITIPAITINAGSTFNLSNRRLRLTGALSVSGTINIGTNIGSRFAGMVTINTGGVWSNASNVAVDFRGGLTNNGGTFTAGTGIQTFSTLAQAIGGTSPIAIPNLTVTGVALTNNGDLTVATALGGTGSLVNSATGTLNIGGTSAITTLTATAVGNVVNYTGAAAQTVKAATYDTLNFSGAGVKTNTGIVTVNTALSGTALTNGATGTLNIGGTSAITTLTATAVGNIVNYTGTGQTVKATSYATLNVTGTAANSGAVTVATALGGAGTLTNAATGILNIGGTSAITTLDATAVGNVVNYTGAAAQTVKATTYDTLNFSGAGVKTNTGIVTVNTALSGTALTNGATGTLNIGGTSAITTLTATAVGNTVNYTGVAVQTVNATAFHHLGLSGSGAKTMTGVTAIGGDLSISGAATMTANAAFTVTGALNYASTGATTLTAATPISIGSFNQSSGAVIDNGNTITVTGAGAGTWTQSAGTFTPTGTVIFTGAAPQIGVSNFNNLTISIGAGNAATLTGNAALSGMLTLTSGFFTTGANTLEIASSCITAISGASSTNYVLGNLSLHYPTGSTTCSFPIGDAIAYTPATIAMTNVTSTLASSTLTARTDTGDHADTTAGAAGIDAVKSVNRYWTLTPGVSLAFATYDTTFAFAAGDIDGGAATANFIIGRKNGVSWAYPVMGAKNPTDTTATGMTQAGSFGEFVIGERLMPSITMLKTVAIISDPVSGVTNPKFIPGAVAQYTLIASNSGGPADNSSTFIADPVPANSALYVNDIGGAGSGPVLFTQGTASSTLAYTFTALNNMADDVSFSNDGGTTWTAVPVADAFGCDPTITHIRVNPKGTFVGSAVAPNPSFQLSFRVCVQ